MSVWGRVLLLSRENTSESDGSINLSSTFQFIKIKDNDKRLFCLQQSVPILAWILYCKQDVLPPIEWLTQKSPSPLSWFKRFRRYAGFFKQQTKLILVFVLYKYQWRNIEQAVSLPKYGQVCFPVHQGYKIFDLRKGVVTKVFDGDVSVSVMRDEIDMLRRASQIEFAPSLNQWHMGDKWYEEEFLYGALDSSSPPPDSKTLGKKFEDEIVPFLCHLVLLQQPTIIRRASEYVEGVIQYSDFSRLSIEEPVPEYCNALSKCFEEMVERIRGEGNCSIFLVFAHGDFVPANMVNTRDGIKLIDWEHAGCRSALFDFYSYFFNRTVSRKIPVRSIVSEIDAALPIFLDRVSRKAPDVSESICRWEECYRWTFFIEILSKLVSRERSDKNLDIKNYIVRYIHTFAEYEKLSRQGSLPNYLLEKSL